MPIYKMQGKKDGKQKYRVRINYQDGNGKAKQIDRVVYGSDEAKLLEMQLAQSIKEETPSKSMSVQELFDEYMLVKKHEVRESSLDKSRRVLKYHVLPDMGDKKIHKLSLQILQTWKLDMEKKDLALTTKKNAYGEFRALLNYAVKMEYIPKNPLVKVGNFKSTIEPKKEMDFYTADEFIEYIAVAKECAQKAEDSNNINEWHYYVFFAIAFYTGLRKGEIHGLQWSDIKDGYLSVNRSVAQKLKGGDRETPPKNRSSIRTLQLPAPLISILAEHKDRCKKIDGFDDTYKICGGIKPLRDNTIQNRNKQYAELAGIKTIRIHDFRHSHASLLANEGINIQEIARRLGHSKIEITWGTYSHLYPREEERAIQILDKIV